MPPPDPWNAVETPLSEVVGLFEDMTGVENSAAWVGHIRTRLHLDEVLKRDGTVISDDDLREKLERVSEERKRECDP